MGSWLSTARLPWGNKQSSEDFRELKAQGYFNSKLAPTREELCRGDDGGDKGRALHFIGEDEEEEDEDESLILGRKLRSCPGDKYNESESTLENRRPWLYHSFFS